MIEIKIFGRYTNPTILILKHRLQIVASPSPHLFAKCAEQTLFIRKLIISDVMFILWIMLNPSNL